MMKEPPIDGHLAVKTSDGENRLLTSKWLSPLLGNIGYALQQGPMNDPPLNEDNNTYQKWCLQHQPNEIHDLVLENR